MNFQYSGWLLQLSRLVLVLPGSKPLEDRFSRDMARVYGSIA